MTKRVCIDRGGCRYENGSKRGLYIIRVWVGFTYLCYGPGMVLAGTLMELIFLKKTVNFSTNRATINLFVPRS